MAIHIHTPEGKFFAQVKKRGARRWVEVGVGAYSDKECAALAAISSLMCGEYTRARVIFCADYYCPVLVMEACK